jgi:hypothetical protein
MRTLVVLLSLGFFAASCGLASVRRVPGEVVSCAEVEHAMGAACVAELPANSFVDCFDPPNCGGCGCAKIYSVVAGVYTPGTATPCSMNQNCSAVQSVETSCSGGG